MLIFQDFSKFLKILKSTVQYLCRDISNVKIGLYLRSSHKKDWKTHFWPYSLKKSKKWKKKTRAPPHFSVSFRQKKNFENRTTVAMRLAPPPSPRHSKSSTPVCMYNVCMKRIHINFMEHYSLLYSMQFRSSNKRATILWESEEHILNFNIYIYYIYIQVSTIYYDEGLGGWPNA